ncbi:MAG TPA: twin-arginine translocation signal domain-containing protein, partial [Thermoanaerobaculia bacterium]|nr:twin-arginine translocation signal domain-containing protein [Thermoanaerobaculia bacterium]
MCEKCGTGSQHNRLVDRRSFLRYAGAGAAAIGGASLLAQDPISAGTASAVRSFELEETSIAQLQEAMSSGRLGAR